MKKKPNKLAGESSLYLRQHAYNPVEWYPWGDEAFSKARNENKLLLLSIGYSACHWCHVMEHESFSDEEVAAFMNRYFVCVKIDREERPDLDQLYMESVQLLHGHGGWPLNCFALPDGRPFWGGTYFTKTQWLGVLEQISSLYSNEPDTLRDQADRIYQGISQMNIKVNVSDEDEWNKLDFSELYSKLAASFDCDFGGLRGAPKFPMPSIYRFLLHYHHVYKNQQALDHVLLTLNQMASGGIYDQIGGGFARYSTDKHWKVPHFEKMLYDNAQLITLYCEVFLVSGNRRLLSTAVETMQFLEREMGSPGTGFAASIDADSPEGEGAFYTFTQAGLNDLLGDEAALFQEYFKVGKEGRWEGESNILLAPLDFQVFCHDHNVNPIEFRSRLQQARTILYNYRQKRPAPAVDTKVVTSWNSFVIIAYLSLYRATLESVYLENAEQLAKFITDNLVSNETGLLHIPDKQKNLQGFLDDYAATILAFISLYGISFNEKWLWLAKSLAESAIDQFYDQSTGLFYYTGSNHEKAFARRQEIHDNVIPSSNSMMMECLLELGHYFEIESFLKISRNAVLGMAENILQHPSAFSNWARVLLMHTSSYYTVAITGKDASQKLLVFINKFLPQILIAGSETQSRLPFLANRFKEETFIYVCVGKVCYAPLNDAESAIHLMHGPQESGPE